MLRRSLCKLCSNADSKAAKLAQDIHSHIQNISDNVLKPNDPFGYVPQATYHSPMVLLLGNHSSGKSTFINHLLGSRVQQTGVAPTDDGFTVIMRSNLTMDIDGPSAVSHPSYQLQELRDFNQNFINRFRVKTRVLPEESRFPEGMMLIDSPGMIDTPQHSQNTSRMSIEGQGRGYDFLKVVEWLARRADVILLMFDPANPGTTGETLDVLTKSLQGMEHKFLILMNKVDMFDKVTDFARAYGTICWNLSKVIPMKDIPRIYTTYTPIEDRPVDPNKTAVPLSEMERSRREVLEEVLRAPLRRLDNIITEMEEAARRVLMNARVCTVLRRRYMTRAALCVAGAGSAAFVLPAMAMMTFFPIDFASLFVMGIASVGMLGGSKLAIDAHLKNYSTELLNTMDGIIEDLYPGKKRTEDINHRWEHVVKPTLTLEAKTLGIYGLPSFSHHIIQKLEKIVEKDVQQLRKDVSDHKEITVRGVNLGIAKCQVDSIAQQRA